MIPTIIDIAILLVLAFFTWRGAKKGLILTLFSLVAIFVAWFGAKGIAGAFSGPVANIIRPSIQLAVDEAVSGVVPAGPEKDPSPSSSPSVVLPGSPVDIGTEDAGSGLTLRQVADALERSDLYIGLRGFVDEAVEEDRLEVTSTAEAAVTYYLAELTANALLFGLSFLLILLVWYLISRALDLAFHLPILAAVNAVGGAILGLAKGVLLMLVVIWLARLSGLLTDELAGPVAANMTVEGLSDLLRSLVKG